MLTSHFATDHSTFPIGLCLIGKLFYMDHFVWTPGEKDCMIHLSAKSKIPWSHPTSVRSCWAVNLCRSDPWTLSILRFHTLTPSVSPHTRQQGSEPKWQGGHPFTLQAGQHVFCKPVSLLAVLLPWSILSSSKSSSMLLPYHSLSRQQWSMSFCASAM
jgi:hypothetical protein